MMNDSSRFGMAKSFFMAGQASGFDMSSEEETQRYIAQHKASLAAEQERRGPSHSGSNRKLRKRISKLSAKQRKKGR